MKKLIQIGTILSPHGVRGNIKIQSYTSPADNIFNLELRVNGEKTKITKKNSIKNNQFICSIELIKNREAAMDYKGVKIFCDRESMPDAAEEEFYIEDLKGLVVQDLKTKHQIGRVKNIVNYGAADLVEIDLADKSSTELIEFKKDIFPLISKDAIIMDPEQTGDASIISRINDIISQK